MQSQKIFETDPDEHRGAHLIIGLKTEEVPLSRGGKRTVGVRIKKTMSFIVLRTK